MLLMKHEWVIFVFERLAGVRTARFISALTCLYALLYTPGSWVMKMLIFYILLPAPHLSVNQEYTSHTLDHCINVL